MSVYTSKTNLTFEPKQTFPVDSEGATQTPENMRPTLGPLSAMAYKYAEFRYLVRNESASGSATVRLMAGDIEKHSAVIDLAADQISDKKMVDLSGVPGDALLSVEVEVTTAGDADVTGTVDAALDINLPPTQSGC